MVELSQSLATTTSLTSDVKDYSVNSKTPDSISQSGITYWDYPNSAKYLGYYKTIPELKKAIDALATWTCGKGYETDVNTEVILDHLIGMGEDTFQSICWNLIVQKKIFGDAFAEIIRDEETGTLINLKPLYTGDMRIVIDEQGMIDHYEQRSGYNKSQFKRFETNEILHLMNDRIANEIHGTSVIEACQWVIDARNEAMSDERKIKHRELALGVLYVDSNKPSKIAQITNQYSNSIKNGEVLVLPKDTAELKDPNVNPKDRLQWITYLENFFYQAVGIPRVIATSENFTEASSKVGYLTFEPIYTREQVDLEKDIWNQVYLRIKFNRPPSLSGMMQQSEQKNTGQVGFQPNDVNASITRTE